MMRSKSSNTEHEEPDLSSRIEASYPPSIIIRKPAPYIAIGFFLAICIFIGCWQLNYDPYLHNAEFYSESELSKIDDQSLELLRLSAGLILTMLVIALSATLVVLQLRAQTHTTKGMMTYIANKFVFIFIFLFIGAVTLTMLFASPSFFLKPQMTFPYIVAAMPFLMWAHVGYVYYIIHRLEPINILRDIGNHMDDAIDNLIAEDGKKKINSYHIPIRSTENNVYFISNKPFLAWEYMMKNAIERYDDDIFIRGMITMVQIIQKKKILKDDEVMYFTRFASNYISKITEYCISENRSRLLRIFSSMIEFPKPEYNILFIPASNPNAKTWQLFILDLLDQFITKSIADDDLNAFEASMEAKLRAINYYDDLEITSEYIVNIMDDCINNNQRRLMEGFVSVVMRTYIFPCYSKDPKSVLILMPYLLDICDKIIGAAIDHDDQMALLNSTYNIMNEFIEYSQKNSNESINEIEEFIHKTITKMRRFAIKKSNKWLLKILLKKIMDNFLLSTNGFKSTSKIEEEILNNRKFINIFAVGEDDLNLFDHNLSIIRDDFLPYADIKDNDFFLSFIRMIKKDCENLNEPVFIKRLESIIKTTRFADQIDFENKE